MRREPVRPLRARRLTAALARGLGDRAGTTAIEYGLICSLIFLALAGSVAYFANSTNNMYNKIATNMR